MIEGYIKLHRCILESSWSRQPDFVAVWVYCLLKGNFKQTNYVTKGGSIVKLQPGQFITSREQISKATGVQESKVERVLKAFQSEQQIEQQNKGKFRIISIANWNKYQSVEQQNEQQMNSKRTADEQQMNTDKKVKKEKKVKEREEVKTEGIAGNEKLFPICKAWKAFKEMRKGMKKPMTEYAEGLIVKKLISFQAKGHDPTDVLNLAIENSWQGVYEPKEKNDVSNGMGRTDGKSSKPKPRGIIEPSGTDEDWL